MNFQLYTTAADQCIRHQLLPFAPDTAEVENQVVNLYPEITFQKLEGFGGAITEAAGYVYSQMDEQQKRQLMDAYFTSDEMNYGLVRVHMDSCDFSVDMYEAMSDPSDRELNSFSFARTEKYILPMLRDAQKAAGRSLSLMLSPWSPPAFMKTNGERRYGGKLKPEYYGFWADYLCRYIIEFQKHGFPVKRISLQNEAHAVQTWDSCIYSAEEEKVFLRDHLFPALRRSGLEDIEVFIWDHNKERAYERAAETIDETTQAMVHGIACHWYSGDHFEALDLIQKRFPSLKLVISESCIEYRFYQADAQEENAAKLAHEIIGDLNHGICAFYDWNVLLDETGGPNHAGNLCHAPFMYDRGSRQLLPQLLQQYFYHFSHYLQPGAERIGFSKYTEKLDMTAFLNPDGTIAAVMLNRTDSPLDINLRYKDQLVTFRLAPHSIATGVVE